MGSGSSKVGKGGGGALKKPAPIPKKTPSGISPEQFRAMTDDQKIDTINSIMNSRKKQYAVPDYLDKSKTTKVMYALGLDDKPKVVSDSALDKMSGTEIFRGVYEKGTMPPPSAGAILDQIRHGDSTQLSGSGGSVHGRALYFSTNYDTARSYSTWGRNGTVLRGKIGKDAIIRNESNLRAEMRADTNFMSKIGEASREDKIALYALYKGFDGWYSGSYTMLVNRGKLTMSSKNGSSNSMTWK